jgi:uncharacterized protein
MPNKLYKEKSYYLKQHSKNPINWYPWNKEALNKSKKENKIIILSIGYSSCHWCHVMEKETFQNTSISKFMNDNFISIKVDREERPDIDNLYMEALQYMGIQGGWPLNVFLLPNLKPFYGGTYFNPNQWYSVLNNILEAYTTNKKEFTKSSEKFTKDLKKSHSEKYNTKNQFSIKTLVNEIKIKFDYEDGGIDRVQKFPMPSLWNSLLFYSYKKNDKEIFNHISNTIDKIIEGGIYDQLKGGFYRYSTDKKWIIPHFEKMLYDNGQLLELLSNMYSITKKERFKGVIEDTIKWVTDEMTNNFGGYYSSIDADSEGKEGKYYLWDYDEIKNILNKEELKLASKVFKISLKGELNKKIILKRKYLKYEKKEKINGLKRKLLKIRESRVKPVTDKKIILSWNSIMLKGILSSYQATGNEKYLSIAIKNAEFLKNEFLKKKNLKRIHKSKINAFLEDYAHTISAFIKLFETTQKIKYLEVAKNLLEDSIKLFYNNKNKMFYFSGSNNEKLLTNKIEIFDNVIPSSNSVMFHNLLILGKIYNDKLYINLYNEMTKKLKKYLNNYEFMSNWIFINEINQKMINEIEIKDISYNHKITKEINSWYLPNKILMYNNRPFSLYTKNENLKLSIYLCRNNVCNETIHSINNLKNTITTNQSGY